MTIRFECCNGDRAHYDAVLDAWIPCRECAGRCGYCGDKYGDKGHDFCERCDAAADWSATGGF